MSLSLYLTVNALYVRNSPFTEETLNYTFLPASPAMGVVRNGDLVLPNDSEGMFASFTGGFFVGASTFLNPPQPGLYNISGSSYPPQAEPVLTAIPGTEVFGGVVVCFPIAENDFLVGGSKAVGRVKDGTVVWYRTTALTLGVINAIAFDGSNVLFVWQRIVGSFPGPYVATLRYTTVSVDLTGAGAFDVASFPAMTVDIDSSTGLVNAAGVVAAQMPNFTVAMNNTAGSTPDGLFGGGQRPLFGPAQLVGPNYELSGYSTTQNEETFERFAGPSTLSVAISGSTFTVIETVSATIAVENLGVYLPAESSPGVSIDYISWPLYGFSAGPAPAVPPFWTNLRRAIEVV